MVTLWPFLTWGLDLVGLVNPPSHGYIWILVAMEYFTKWAKAIPLRKTTKRAVTNFIKKNIIVKFRVSHKIISDNGMPFVNSEVRKMLEFYQIKHHQSSPYYPQGNKQVEVKNKTFIKIISKMNQEYAGGRAMHLPNALWAYRSSPKSVTRSPPFSLVYKMEVISPVEVMTPSLRSYRHKRKKRRRKSSQ